MHRRERRMAKSFYAKTHSISAISAASVDQCFLAIWRRRDGWVDFVLALQ